MDMHDLLLKPVITEKTTMMMSDGKYTFKVPLHANKIEIRKAVEKVFINPDSCHRSSPFEY